MDSFSSPRQVVRMSQSSSNFRQNRGNVCRLMGGSSMLAVLVAMAYLLAMCAQLTDARNVYGTYAEDDVGVIAEQAVETTDELSVATMPSSTPPPAGVLTAAQAAQLMPVIDNIRLQLDSLYRSIGFNRMGRSVTSISARATECINTTMATSCVIDYLIDMGGTAVFWLPALGPE